MFLAVLRKIVTYTEDRALHLADLVTELNGMTSSCDIEDYLLTFIVGLCGGKLYIGFQHTVTY